MELSITTGETDIFVYPVDPALPPSVREALSERGAGSGALSVVTVHLTIPSDVKAKHLRAGVHKLECSLVGRENLGFASGGAMEQNIPFSLEKVLDETQVVEPTTAFVTPSHSRPHSPPNHPFAAQVASGFFDGGKSAAGISLFFRGAQHTSIKHGFATPVTPPAELKLEPGKMYSWDFIFDIPQDIAPYERCRYGRLYYRLTAKLTLNSGGGLLGSGRKVLTAAKNAFPNALPTHDGALAYSFNHNAETDLGPLLITARSQHLTVGGYMRFALCMPCVPPDVRLVRVTAKLMQRVTLHSRKRPGLVENCPLESYPLVDTDGSDLNIAPVRLDQTDEDNRRSPAALEEDGTGDIGMARASTSSGIASSAGAGKLTEAATGAAAPMNSVKGEWVTKLPVDDVLRPTSLAGSKSAIRVAHQMVCQIRYTLPGLEAPVQVQMGGKESVARWKQPVHVYQATWDIDVPSCAAKYDSVRLPSYSALDSQPVPSQGRDEWQGPNEHESHSHCACGQSLEELLEVEQRVGEEQSNTLNLLDALRADLESMRTRSQSQSRGRDRSQSHARSRARSQARDHSSRSRSRARSPPRSRSQSQSQSQPPSQSHSRAQSRGRTAGRPPHVAWAMPAMDGQPLRAVDVRAGLLHSGMFGPTSDDEDVLDDDEGYLSPDSEDESVRLATKQSQLYQIVPPEQYR